MKVITNQYHPMYNANIFKPRFLDILKICKDGWVMMKDLAEKLKIKSRNIHRYTSVLLSIGALEMELVNGLSSFDGFRHYTKKFKTVYYPTHHRLLTKSKFEKEIDKMWDYGTPGVEVEYLEDWSKDFIKYDVEKVLLPGGGEGGTRGSVCMATQSALDYAIRQWDKQTTHRFDKEFMFGQVFILPELK